MSDSWENLVRRSCVDKIQHRSCGAAKKHLARLLEATPTYNGEVYECMFCRKWHVGRKAVKPKSTAERKAAKKKKGS